MSTPEAAARPLSAREREWCEWLLPRHRPAYASLIDAIERLEVIGIGRWGAGDLVLGANGQSVDLEAPMEPVAAYGEIVFDDEAVLSVSVHHPDDESRIELHVSGPALDRLDERTERSRWCYSYWRPGEPAPSGGGPPRQVRLDAASAATSAEATSTDATSAGAIDELVLALDSTRRVMWLHDERTGGNTLVPVTNFYNELMLLKGVRDPAIALAHRRLFEVPEENSDAELRAAFVRYNRTWRKVGADRLGAETPAPAEKPTGLLARLGRALRGGTER